MRVAAAVGSGEQGWRSEAETPAASACCCRSWSRAIRWSVFGSLLGLVAALLLEVVVGDDRFGGLGRLPELGYGLALLLGGVEVCGERLGFVLAGLAGFQPGVVVVVGDQRLDLFVDFVDAGDVGGPFPSTPDG